MAKLKLLLSGLVSLFIAAGVASAQTVSIVSGQGQASCAFFCTAGFEPLVVVVKDANGAPMPNAAVTWTVSGPGSITGGTQNTTTTDANGQTSVLFAQQGSTSYGQSFLQSTVTAAVGASSVLFYESTVLVGQNGALLVNPLLVQPTVGATVSGQSGQTAAGAVQIYVGISNVAVQIVPVTDGTTSSVKCAPTAGQPDGIVLSDGSGSATCNLVFGAGLGTTPFAIAVGKNLKIFQPIYAEVTSGPPCILSLVSGNNQSGNAGANLTAPLVAKVTDCGGNPLSGVPVNWGPTTPSGGATFFNTRSSSDTSGLVSTNVKLGVASGAVSIPVAVASGTATANNTPVSVTFTVNVNLTISTFQKLSGDSQDAAQGTQFAQPLAVQVNGPSGPTAGVTVNFAVSSGSATLSAASAVTNAQGQASVTATAGSTVGPVVVTASIGSFSQAFNLTVRTPGPSNVSFLNGAGFQQNFIAPCGIATITGNSLAPGIQGVVIPNYYGPMPIQVANVTVQFGNTFAPIYSVANQSGQESVTVQVPCDVAAGNVPVTIKVGGGSAQFTAQVSSVAPGIFEYAMSDGKRRAVLVKPDGTYVSLENPARRGEIIHAWVTGLGTAFTPTISTNSPGIPDVDSMINDLGSIAVGVNNGGVRVVSAKYAQNLIGVYEIAFQVPDDVPAGNLNFAISIAQGGNRIFGNPSQIPVQ
jgi:uncharacterized protein (TIGR03437 family)